MHRRIRNGGDSLPGTNTSLVFGKQLGERPVGRQIKLKQTDNLKVSVASLRIKETESWFYQSTHYGLEKQAFNNQVQ